MKEIVFVKRGDRRRFIVDDEVRSLSPGIHFVDGVIKPALKYKHIEGGRCVWMAGNLRHTRIAVSIFCDAMIGKTSRIPENIALEISAAISESLRSNMQDILEMAMSRTDCSKAHGTTVLITCGHGDTVARWPSLDQLLSSRE